MPLVKGLVTTYGAKGVEVLSLNAFDERADALAEIKEAGLTHRQLLGADAAAKAYGVRGVPSVFVVGGDGKVLVSDGDLDLAKRALDKALGAGR